MRRNGRRVVVGLAVLAVLAAGGGFAIFELTSGDAPPPPTLSADDRGFAGVAAGEWRVRPARGAFAGYRVDEKYPFGIEPPSVAGLVTVRDHGALEFRLIATHA
jgi:hypothetical protein